MKVYVIKSDHSEVPLAEVRTDGDTAHFVVDNTNGKLPQMVQSSLPKLRAICDNSSHMHMEEPKTATVNLLRYVMDNGDVVEITSDGHTVMLNGHLLPQEEKDALFNAFTRGEIKVARKTDVQQALPVLPSNPPSEYAKPQSKMNPTVLGMIEDDQDKKDTAREMATRDYDPAIDDAELSDVEDADWTKELMRWLKYGDKNE
jgi:hypothetical protein